MHFASLFNLLHEKSLLVLDSLVQNFLTIFVHLFDTGMAKYEKLPFLNLHAVHIHTIAYEVITNKACNSTNQVKLSG